MEEACSFPLRTTRVEARPTERGATCLTRSRERIWVSRIVSWSWISTTPTSPRAAMTPAGRVRSRRPQTDSRCRSERANAWPARAYDGVRASALEERRGRTLEGAAEPGPVTLQGSSDEHIGVAPARDQTGDLAVGVSSHLGEVVVNHARSVRGTKAQARGGGELAHLPVALVAVSVEAKACPVLQAFRSLAG